MITSLILLVVYIVVLALIVFLLNYLVDNVPMQEPYKRVAKIAILVVGVLILILLLLNFIGVLDSAGPPRLRP
jgi:heme/copper-type cytochrome/quinol oxidase subunit 2